MRRFEFTEEQRQTIAHERFYHPDPAVQRRMEILWLKLHGETHERIAVLTETSRRTVQRVLDLFWNGGLEAVRQFHWHRPTSELTAHARTLEEEFRQRPPHTVAEACQRIEELTGVVRGREQVRLFLKQQLGLNWRKVAAVPVPPKQSVEEHAAKQADFLKSGP
jgi:transposase